MRFASAGRPLARLRPAFVLGLGAVLLAGCGGKGAPEARPPPARLIAYNHTDEGGVHIYLVAADGSRFRRLNRGNGDLSYDLGLPTWSPDGKRLAFTGQGTLGEGPHVYVVAARGAGRPRALAAGAFPVWSPDGRRIAYTSQARTEIYVMASDGNGQRLLARDASSGATWSPDGRRIAFTSDAGGHDEIDVVDRDGRDRRQLTGDPARKSGPSWSPDGRRLVFQTARRDGAEIEVIAPDGSGRRRLAHVSDTDGAPAWSPRGRRIAFDGAGIAVMAADGSGLRHLTTDQSDSSPAWSPDGTRIVFVRVNADGGTTLYVMKADGTQQRRLTYGTAGAGAPAWQPGA